MTTGDIVSQTTWNRPGEVGVVADFEYDDSNPSYSLLLVRVIYRDGYWCWCKPSELKKEA